MTTREELLGYKLDPFENQILDKIRSNQRLTKEDMSEAKRRGLIQSPKEMASHIMIKFKEFEENE